jgi:O-antigen/teichoic acid export membrane protein
MTGLARGLNRVGSAFFPGVVLRPLLLLAAAFALIAAGYPLTSPTLLGALLLVLPIILLVQLGVFRAALPPDVADARPVYTPRAWLDVALPLLVVGACGVALVQIDLLVVGALAGRADAGLYHVAARTAAVMSVVLTMGNSVAAPQFAAMHARGDREGLQALTTAVTQWAFWPSLAAALAFVLLAEPLLALFGRAFVTARVVLVILAVGQLVNTATGPAGVLLNTTGHHRSNLRVSLWMIAMKLVLTVIGVLGFCLVGAATAAATTTVVGNLWRCHVVRRQLGIDASILYPLARARARR